MASLTNQMQVTFTLKDFKCVSFELKEYANSISKQISNDGYEFQFNFELALVKETTSANVVMSTTLLEKVSDTEKNELAILKIEMIFIIKNFADVFKMQDDKLLIPDPLIVALSNIAIGGIRGMFVLKLESSKISNAIVPLVDAKMFLPKRLETVS